MPILFKCPYIKPGTGGAAVHLGNYVRYAATRERVEKLTPDKAALPATKTSGPWLDRILRDFPMFHNVFEYEDYHSSPTRAAASEFITRAIEDNHDQIAKRENYVSYIAQRPRAERIGAHGLFNGTGDTLVLSRIAEEVANHPGNVWLPIISLRREDAARLGYDNAERWRTFLRSYAAEMEDTMKIPQRSDSTNTLRYAGESRIEQLTDELAQQLKRTTGKKQYGYLNTPLKLLVDEIVDELAKGPRIAAAYDLWYQLREKVLRTYKDDLPHRLPLSQQKEFKRIKNLMIREAVRLGEYAEVFDPTDFRESEQTGEDANSVPEEGPQNTNGDEVPHIDRRSPKAKYQAAKRTLTDSSSKPEQIGQAVDWLTQAAEAGLDYAQYALGKLYRDGGLVEQDTIQAVIWFSQAAEQRNQYAQYAPGKTFRINVEGSDPRCSFHCTGSSNRIYIFEAPIDLLPFLTCHPRGWQEHSFVSLIRWQSSICAILPAQTGITFSRSSTAIWDICREQPSNLAARAKAEKYVKILAKTIINPEGDPSKNFMAGLMIQTLSRELFSVADENGGKLPNRVVLFCDELGTMPGL